MTFIKKNAWSHNSIMATYLKTIILLISLFGCYYEVCQNQNVGQSEEVRALKVICLSDNCEALGVIYRPIIRQP